MSKINKVVDLEEHSNKIVEEKKKRKLKKLTDIPEMTAAIMEGPLAIEPLQYEPPAFMTKEPNKEVIDEVEK